MSTWQWLYQGNWIDCTPENTEALEQRKQTPSLENLFLINTFGELWGSPESGTIKFRVHGDAEETRSKVRIAPNSGECTLFQLKDGPAVRIIPPGPCSLLFEDDKPSIPRRECSIGTERYVAEEGQLYHLMDGVLIAQQYRDSELSWGQFEQMTQSQYSWEFKGPFRWERMREAVQKTCAELPVDSAARLQLLFSHFDPMVDATEYGPYQFDDFLSTMGEVDLAFQLMEKYHSQDTRQWQKFSPVTNARIENARSSGRPVAIIQVRGQTYMIIFDAGSGASGGGPVVVRTTRYQKILESIEEQFQESQRGSNRQCLKELFELLQQHDIEPREFLRATIANPNDWQLAIDPEIRQEATRIMGQLDNMASGANLSTRIQQFMPMLLQKFKECEVRLSLEEENNPTKLCPRVMATLKEGMCVPPGLQFEWRTMIKFIYKYQCWKLEGPPGQCDICASSAVQLTHCGSSSACMKCWTSTLVKTKFTCPFCRQDIGEGSLKLYVEIAKPVTSQGVKRKRATQFKGAKALLDIIHEDKLYKDVTKKTSFGMRKWFTILLRRGLVNIHQRPDTDQQVKSFESAMILFKLLPKN